MRQLPLLRSFGAVSLVTYPYDRFDLDRVLDALRVQIARVRSDGRQVVLMGVSVGGGICLELLRRALKIEPGNASFLDSLGWAFFKQGKLADAEAPLAEAAAKMPTNSVIQDHLGDLRFQQKRYAEAIGAWERALGGDGESIDRAVIERKLRDARSRVPKN